MPVLSLETHVATAEHDALAAVTESLRDLLWLARDIGGGEHECGAAHLDQHLDAAEEAIAGVVRLAGGATGRRLVRPSISALRAALIERMAENAAGLIFDEPRRTA